MKIVNDDGSELNIKSEEFKRFLELTSEVITEGLIQKFIESQGVRIAGIVPLVKQYCDMAEFFFEENKESYNIVREILDSKTPYKIFTEKYKDIKVIDNSVLTEWKNLIEKQLKEVEQDFMFS